MACLDALKGSDAETAMKHFAEMAGLSDRVMQAIDHLAKEVSTMKINPDQGQHIELF